VVGRRQNGVSSTDVVMEQDGTARCTISFSVMLRRKDGLSGGTQEGDT
jgi:hypothetical protein